MGFRKEKNIESTDRFFLDREDIFESLENDVHSYLETDDYYMLYAFCGMGGIGKSRLVEQIYAWYNGGSLQTYKIPLEILNKETIPAILLHIRCFFSYTPHFDYVLIRYYDFIKFDRVNRETLYNIVEKAGLYAGEAFGNVGPLSFKPVINALINLYEERDIQDCEKECVAKLLQGKIEDLYKYMTQKLAEDIERELQHDKYMFLFDAYNIGINSGFDWLYNFINTFQTGIFIVTSRESLRWFEGNNVDASLYKNIPLESIPSQIVEDYLKQLGYTNKQISIIKDRTDCVPIFLDIILNSYSKEEINENVFVYIKDKGDIIKNFLSHLSGEEQNIISYLSVVGLFNEDVYGCVLGFNELSRQQYSFKEFRNSTIVRYIEEFEGLYKIHSVLAHNIVLTLDESVRYMIVTDYTEFIWARILNSEIIDIEVKYNFIANVYSLIKAEKISLSDEMSEKLIDMYLYLFDRSYAGDFANSISKIQDKENDSLKYIYQYIEGKAERLNNIVKGLQILTNIPVDKCGFGKHKKSLECDINYLLSISGKYNKAEAKMNKFAKELREDEKGERYYTEGIIYDCDMKMLRGKFKSSVEGLLTLEDSVSASPLLFEINKAVGHNYRFNFLMETAMDFYQKINKSEEAAYFYTVYCETYCYSEPQLVIDIYKEAKAENQKYNNHNNLGKIYYSMAIAYLLMREYNLAQKYINKSKKEFNTTHYLAGTIFAKIAQAYLEYSQTKNISSSKIKNIHEDIGRIDNIYEYLLLPLYVAREDNKKIEEYRTKFEWFSYDETLENIKRFLSLL